jgi:hypothetical protein
VDFIGNSSTYIVEEFFVLSEVIDMAENLLSKNGYPILHTYSKYAKNNIDLSFINKLN